MKFSKAKDWLNVHKVEIMSRGVQVAALGGLVYGVHKLLKEGDTDILDEVDLETFEGVEFDNSLMSYIGGLNSGVTGDGGSWILQISKNTVDENGDVLVHDIWEVINDIVEKNYYEI